MVAKFVQAPPHSAQPAAFARRDVLDDRDGGAEGCDDSVVLPPEAGALAVEPIPASGAGHVLAWEAAADDVDGFENIKASCADIGDTPVSIRPVLREHRPAKVVLFYLPHGSHRAPGLPESVLDPLVESTDPGKE